jgi:hypothetical protein
MNECPKLAAWKRLHERIATYRDGSKWRAYVEKQRDIEGMAYAIAWRKRNLSPIKKANKRPQPASARRSSKRTSARNSQLAIRNSKKK